MVIGACREPADFSAVKSIEGAFAWLPAALTCAGIGSEPKSIPAHAVATSIAFNLTRFTCYPPPFRTDQPT